MSKHYLISVAEKSGMWYYSLMENVITSRRGLNANGLKLIAAATMLIDHIGYKFAWEMPLALTYTFRGIGRIAMPIYCFMLVEGLFHTRDVKKYLLRMAAFTVISEVPFDLMISDRAVFMRDQTVMFTLTVSLCCAAAVRLIGERVQNGVLQWVLGILVIASGCAVCVFLRTDYTAVGVIMVFAFYFGRGNKLLTSALLVFSNVILDAALYGTGSLWFTEGMSPEFLSLFALAPIFFYNGERGKVTPVSRYGFYVFYPAHMLALYAAARIIL